MNYYEKAKELLKMCYTFSEEEYEKYHLGEIYLVEESRRKFEDIPTSFFNPSGEKRIIEPRWDGSEIIFYLIHSYLLEPIPNLTQHSGKDDIKLFSNNYSIEAFMNEKGMFYKEKDSDNWYGKLS